MEEYFELYIDFEFKYSSISKNYYEPTKRNKIEEAGIIEKFVILY